MTPFEDLAIFLGFLGILATFFLLMDVIPFLRDKQSLLTRAQTRPARWFWRAASVALTALLAITCVAWAAQEARQGGDIRYYEMAVGGLVNGYLNEMSTRYSAYLRVRPGQADGFHIRSVRVLRWYRGNVLTKVVERELVRDPHLGPARFTGQLVATEGGSAAYVMQHMSVATYAFSDAEQLIPIKVAPIVRMVSLGGVSADSVVEFEAHYGDGRAGDRMLLVSYNTELVTTGQAIRHAMFDPRQVGGTTTYDLLVASQDSIGNAVVAMRDSSSQNFQALLPREQEARGIALGSRSLAAAQHDLRSPEARHVLDTVIREQAHLFGLSLPDCPGATAVLFISASPDLGAFARR